MGGVNVSFSSFPGIGLTYLPIATPILNIDSVTVNDFFYHRVGNIVMAQGFGIVNATAGGGAASQFLLSLPVVRSAFTLTNQLTGSGIINAIAIEHNGAFSANVGTAQAQFNFNSDSTLNRNWVFALAYQLTP